MAGHWTLIYDARDHLWGWVWVALITFVFCFVGFHHIRSAEPSGPDGTRTLDDKTMAILGACILCAFAAAGLFSLWTSARDVIALDSGRYRLLEGPITAMVKRPWKGHASELFSVQSQRLLYDGDTATSNDTGITDPGCLYEGLPARIATTGHHVLRMEVLIPQAAPPRYCEAEFGEAPAFDAPD